jgi:hypothetical protein
MSSSAPSVDPRAKGLRFSEDELSVFLADGRTISVPLAWFPRLLHASPQQRRNWEILGDGDGIHWPEIDEDVSVAGLLQGVAAEAAEPAARDPRRRS